MLADIVLLVVQLLGVWTTPSPGSFEYKTLTPDECKRILDHTLRSFDAMRAWERDTLYEQCKALADAMDFKIRDFLFPLFVAVSGRSVALPLFDSLDLLGADLIRTRIRSAIAALGGVSKKEAKRMEKSFRELEFHT